MEDAIDTAVEKATRRREAERRWAALTIDHDGHCRALDRFLAGAVPVDRWVVLYDAMGTEVDLGGLVAAHPDPPSRYALTRTPDSGRTLTVHPWGGPLERHRYGYRQPRASSPAVADDRIGAVVVPGLAFDRRGHRLGRGAGYYDRFLARLPPQALRIGVTGGLAFDDLPVEDHDVAMTHLVDGEGVVAVRRARSRGPDARPSPGPPP